MREFLTAQPQPKPKPVDPVIHSALSHPGNITFHANRPFVHDLSAAGGRVVRQARGHFIFYGPDNRRFLATDPEGNPFHECEWVAAAKGTVLVPDHFLRRWDPVTVFFAENRGPAQGPEPVAAGGPPPMRYQPKPLRSQRRPQMPM